MDYDQSSINRVLRSLEEEPEEVRRLFIYATCATMAEVGMLEYMGVSYERNSPVVLLFRNPDTGVIVEVPKPDLSCQEDEAIKDHIRQLLFSRD